MTKSAIRVGTEFNSAMIQSVALNWQIGAEMWVLILLMRKRCILQSHGKGHPSINGSAANIPQELYGISSSNIPKIISKDRSGNLKYRQTLNNFVRYR